MQRLDRLERVTDLLLVLLDTSHPLSLREIAHRVPGYPDTHEARRQAFERDKRLLRDEGVPVLVEPIGGEEQLGYRVDPDAYYLPDLGLEPDEQAALNLAVAGVHLGEPTGRDALEKLGVSGEVTVGGDVAPLVVLPPIVDLPALPSLFEAARRHALATFGYRGETRRVDVAAIRFRRGRWYAVGHDRDRGEARTFRVDRIEGAIELGEPSSGLADDVEVDAAFEREPWQFGGGEAVEVDVLVDGPEAARVAEELGTHAVVERRSGGVVVRLAVTDEEALVSWVLGLLDHAEVLAPAETRTAVEARLEAMIAAQDGAAGS
jgi:predicted DNA-binding transcriptional regulator YafY